MPGWAYMWKISIVSTLLAFATAGVQVSTSGKDLNPIASVRYFRRSTETRS